MSLPPAYIIIPNLNHIELFSQTIVPGSLQDYTNIELIISNNESRDGTNYFVSQLIDTKPNIINSYSAGICM